MNYKRYKRLRFKRKQSLKPFNFYSPNRSGKISRLYFERLKSLDMPSFRVKPFDLTEQQRLTLKNSIEKTNASFKALAQAIASGPGEQMKKSIKEMRKILNESPNKP